MKLIKTSMMCLAAGLCLAAQAQTSRTELMAHLDLATGNYCNYPNPSGHITPAPDGYEPFYVTHYGRHGARYMTSDKHYKYTIGKMDTALHNIRGQLGRRSFQYPADRLDDG